MLIVPTPIIGRYVFGENQHFHACPHFLGVRLWMVRRLRIGAPLFTGRWGLPLFLWPVRRSRVVIVFGRPVEVGEPNSTPTDEQVEAVYMRYVEEVSLPPAR